MEPFVTHVKSPVGIWGVAGTEEGITHFYLPNERMPASKGVAPRSVTSAAAQLREYFSGQRHEFHVTLAPTPATNFQRAVWSALCTIPYGQVCTYGEVARAVNRPRAVRAVGNANHANPWPIIVPCHRVVGASGLGGYGGGEVVKRFLLRLEGVEY